MEKMNRLLVCPPDHFKIAYEINSWMHVEVAADQALARVQWDTLMAVLEKDCGAKLERMAPAREVPDMVFTANAAAMSRRTAILSRFRFAERQPEEAYFERWFLEHGFTVEKLPEGMFFEGAGDLLGFDSLKIGGYRQRTDIRAYQHVCRMIDCEIIPVELIDPRFSRSLVARHVLGGPPMMHPAVDVVIGAKRIDIVHQQILEPGTLGEVPEQVELLRGELDGVAGDAHLAPDGVDCDFSALHDLGSGASVDAP